MTITSSELTAEIVATLSRAAIPDTVAEAARILEAARQQAHDEEYPQRARDLAMQRARGVPLEYLTKRVRFMGVEMCVARGALIPREETELLGRTALEIVARFHTTPNPRVIDMCCGSGNLSAALATHHRELRVWASDLTDGAVAVARANVEQLQLCDRVVVMQGDLFSPLLGLGLEGTIDVVVCNPPYISTGKLAKERAALLDHEPREAFDGGPYGVAIYQRVVRDAALFLKPGGHLLFEIGAGQERQVTSLVARSKRYDKAISVPDFSGQPRVVITKKTTETQVESLPVR